MMRTLRASRSVLLVLFVLGLAARAGSSELTDDLKARRARAMDKLGPDAMLIVWSAPTRVYSRDIDYEYRQDSNLYYLTGVTQPNTILVLMPGNVTRRAILFVQPRNPTREHWTGHVLSTDEAKAASGVDRVFSTNEFDSVIAGLLTGDPVGGDKEPVDADKFSQALAAGRAKVALVLPRSRPTDPLTPEQEFAKQIRERYHGFAVADATAMLATLRVVKTPYERTVLKKSVEISGEAQMAGMRTAHAGVREYEVLAAIEAAQKTRGAESWSYPSIVGSGPNATILHYPRGDRMMNAGELLLVDAACSYGYMAADITRTYPISGRFTPLQKEIYQIVLRAQEASMKAAKPGSSLKQMHDATVEVIKVGLLSLGLITDTSGDQYRMWYTHGSSHYIGLDVHDVGDNKWPLAPGMAFTIEPGIYVRPSVLENLPRTPENLALIEKIQLAVKKYADIGVRIEDSYLYDEGGLQRLSASVPRTVEEIESFLKTNSSR